jgi:hypothetical protein
VIVEQEHPDGHDRALLVGSADRGIIPLMERP